MSIDFIPPCTTVSRAKLRSHRYCLIRNNSIPRGEYSTATQAAAAAMKFAGHPGPRTRQFRDPEGWEILRLLGTGGQLVCPPSLHPSGERREWDSAESGPGRPAVVDYPAFLAAVQKLAEACGWVAKETAASEVRATSCSFRNFLGLSN